MYIKKINIKNFRTFDENGLELNFVKGINTIVGENNIGKTTIIDAIQLALSSWQYARTNYVKVDDFHINKYGERADKIMFDIYFSELNEEQRIAFFHFLDGKDNTKAEVHVTYTLKVDANDRLKIIENLTGGPGFNSINKNELDYINMLYLPALRNVDVDLKPSRKSHIADIFKSIASTEKDKERLLKSLLLANDKIKNDSAIIDLQNTLNKNLLSIEKELLNQKVSVNVLEPSFDSIAASLGVSYQLNHQFIKIHKDILNKKLEEIEMDFEEIKDKLKELEDDCFELDLVSIKNDENYIKLYNELISVENSDIPISRNGLGYNNILSMATSMTSLQKKPQADSYSIFLIEEPEAHLHPQLLELLFNFFKNSNEDDNIQVFITSHSPTLVSKSDIDSVHIIGDVSGSVSLKYTNLTDDEKDDLKRYLDVTKSQLFFAKRVIFVEGITEAILVNTFAKLLKKPLDKYSTEIVNINGVSFDVFAKLFTYNAENPEKHYLDIPCSIISDNDRCTNKDDQNRIREEDLKTSTFDVNEIKRKLAGGKVSYRALKLLEFNKEPIGVYLAEKTLEYELALKSENNSILLEVLGMDHPNLKNEIKTFIDSGEDQEKIAIRFWRAIRDCKGSFAQNLARKLEESSEVDFKIPEHIQTAINHVIGDEDAN